MQGPDSRRGLISLAAPSSLSSLGEVGRTELICLGEATYGEAWALAKDKPGVPLGLSARERQALLLVAEGQDDAVIARIMSISTSTAHAHVERSKRRLGASTRAQAVAMAIRAQLI